MRNQSIGAASGPIGRPLRLLFLTSIRDVGENDRVGDLVQVPADDPGTSSLLTKYMEGSIERLIREMKPSGRLHGLFEVAGVVFDDIEERDLDHYSFDDPGKLWVHPRSLNLDCGKLVMDCTTNIPSYFRTLPLKYRRDRQEQKQKFEEQLVDHFHVLKADIIVCEHYMNIVEWPISPEGGLYGKFIKIHPAITDLSHPWAFRGCNPTMDAITAARSTKEPVWTGATLHLINDELDGGPIIAECTDVPVFPSDDPATLRYRIYLQAKLPVCVHGLEHYGRNIYPVVESLADDVHQAML